MRKTTIKRLGLIFATMLCFCIVLIGSLSISTVFGVDRASYGVNIEIDTLTYKSTELPNGLVGKTYPAFNAKVVDDNDVEIGTADVLVYGPDGKLVPINLGRFETKMVGKYTIEYSANVGATTEHVELTFDVVSNSEYTEMFYEVSEEIQKNVNVGDVVYIYDGDFGGGFGDVQIDFSIVYDGKYDCEEVVIKDLGLGERFIPEQVGEYQLVYVLKDVVGNVVTVKEAITVTDNGLPNLQAPSLSPVCHLGDDIELDYTEATIYLNGKKVFVPVKVFVGEEEVTSTMKYTPSAAGIYTVKYVAESSVDNNLKTEYVFDVEVKDVSGDNKPEQYVDGFMKLDNFTTSYRVGDATGDNKQFEGNAFVLTSTEGATSAKMSFKKPVYNEYISFDIGAEPDNTHYESALITFTDCDNADVKVVIELVPAKGGTTDVYVNGILKTNLSKSLTVFNGAFGNNTFNFTFEPTENKLYESGVVICELTHDEKGYEFVGFNNDYVYVSLELKNISAVSSVKFYRIAAQVISNASLDRTKPIMIFPSDFASAYKVDINQTAVVKMIGYYDVFDDVCTVKIRIVGPDKKDVYNGKIEKDYQFVVDQYGTYNIVYTLLDSAGNERTQKAVVEVIDRIAPTMQVVEIQSVAKVGDVIIFPEASVTDNHTEQCTTWIYLLKGNFHKELVIDHEYEFTSKGTHVFTYGAQDDAGNTVLIEYVVEVA